MTKNLTGRVLIKAVSKSFFKGFLDLQRSAHVPFLFNIYLNDSFDLTVYPEVCYFADDAAVIACDNDLNSLMKRL